MAALNPTLNSKAIERLQVLREIDKLDRVGLDNTTRNA